MFTNEQIREAMQGLVDTKGGDHTSIGRYADQFTGRGACFLGALCEYMGLAIPVEGTHAKNALGPNAVTPQMQAAFIVAQYLNDNHFEWKYVLVGVDLALKSDLPLTEGIGCPCGCTNSNAFTTILEEVKAIRALDRSQTAKVNIEKAISEFTTLGQALNTLSLSFAKGGFVTGGFYPSISTTYNTTTPAVVAASKTDHALVA